MSFFGCLCPYLHVSVNLFKGGVANPSHGLSGTAGEGNGVAIDEFEIRPSGLFHLFSGVCVRVRFIHDCFYHLKQ